MGLTNAIDQQQNQSYADLLARAQGVLVQPFPPTTAANLTAPVSGTIYGTSVYAPAGLIVTGIKLRNGVAAAGTPPTTARVGLLDSTGKVLVVGGNVNAAASWPTGVVAFPFSAPFLLASAGAYFPCYIVSGTWGTTQPVPLLGANSASGALAADGAFVIPQFRMTGQTDLPAVGASVTITIPETRSYWLALY